MEAVYAGLDLGTRTCHVIAKGTGGEPVLDEQLPTNEASLLALGTRLGQQARVNLEACELAGWARRLLQPRVAEVIVSHPRTNAWIAKDPHKSDQVDADKLADLLRFDRVHAVYYPDDPARSEFKALMWHRERLVQLQVRLKMQLKGRLRTAGVIVRDASPYDPERRAALLADQSATLQASVGQLGAVLEAVVAQRQAATATLRQAARGFPEVARLATVPGVGLIGACRFVAVIADPFRFRRKQALWRYCGLGITHRSSDGHALGRRRLDPAGVGLLKDVSRKAFESCRTQVRRSTAIRRAYEASLARTGNPTHARLSTQRKILTILWTLWKKGATYQDDLGG